MRAIRLNAKNLRDIILEASRSSKGPVTRKKKIKESVGEEETHVLVGQIEMAVESAAREFFDDMFSADDPSMKSKDDWDLQVDEAIDQLLLTFLGPTAEKAIGSVVQKLMNGEFSDDVIGDEMTREFPDYD